MKGSFTKEDDLLSNVVTNNTNTADLTDLLIQIGLNMRWRYTRSRQRTMRGVIKEAGNMIRRNPEWLLSVAGSGTLSRAIHNVGIPMTWGALNLRLESEYLPGSLVHTAFDCIFNIVDEQTQQTMDIQLDDDFHGLVPSWVTNNHPLLPECQPFDRYFRMVIDGYIREFDAIKNNVDMKIFDYKNARVMKETPPNIRE